MTLLRNHLTSEWHSRVRSKWRARFDWTFYFVCACERETGRETDREASWWLSITRSAGPPWPRSSSWHQALFLPCNSKEECDQEKKISKDENRRGERQREKTGATKKGENGTWGETELLALKWGRWGGVRKGGGGSTNDKQKSWVNKCVSEFTNTEGLGWDSERLIETKWSKEKRVGPELPHYSRNQ